MITRPLFDNYLSRVKSALPNVTTLLGVPEIAQSDAIFPCAALHFESFNEAQTPHPPRRLGQTESPGITIEARLFLFANSEAELLDLIDAFQPLRRTLSAVTGFGVIYGPSQRVDDDEQNPFLRYVTATPVTFTSHGGTI